MKFTPRRRILGAHGRSAFTLIELLAVMAIILVLAGLIINIAGSAQYNSAKARATTEIHGMETAIESYKTDNGAYPSDSANANGGSQPTTEVLDPQDVMNYSDPSKYTNASEFLYQALGGFAVSNGTSSFAKKYMNFTPSQLHLAANAGSATTATPAIAFNYIIDPFGFCYGYSTVYAVTLAAQNNATPPVTTPVTKGYNPTFDLWSTAGYASGGKSTPTSTPSGASPASVYSNLWIKNW